MASKPKKSGKAVSIWATPPVFALYKRVSKASGEPLSKLVRMLVAAYESGKVAVNGLPVLTKPKKAKKPKKAAAAADVQTA